MEEKERLAGKEDGKEGNMKGGERDWKGKNVLGHIVKVEKPLTYPKLPRLFPPLGLCTGT